MDFAQAMHELRTAPGVSIGELDSLKRGILAVATDAATVGGCPVPEVQRAIESAWLAFGGPQALIDQGQRRCARLSAMHREYHRRQRRRRG